PRFNHSSQNFYNELKNRVNAYFKETGKKESGNSILYTKAILYTLGFAATYCWLVFFTPAVGWALLGCVLLGGFAATIGFNIMHDGAHGSFSKYPRLNDAAAWSLNVLGGSSIMWKIKHNVIHHGFTNIEGMDDDIEAQPFLRMAPQQKLYPLHRFQHIYFPFLYGLLYFAWIFHTDYKKYFTGKVNETPFKSLSAAEHISFWSFKVLNLFLFVVLPIIMVGFLPFLIGFAVFVFMTGVSISIVFQLAHTVEHTEFPVPDADTGFIENEWAIHQVNTTANFATRNKVWHWLLGGLNFQIEHHLFPKISHVHYPALSRIVKKACADYGINYIEYPTMRTALASHVSFLKRMGVAA
ncbi:MAG: acyl-CoA desaturase, partial [Saprospiraceae bacterium]